MQESYETDHTLEVVNLINTRLYIPGFSGEQIKLPAASPNWFGSGTQDVIHGWATPPMPVATDNPCIAYGHCHIYFQKLTEDMQNRRGGGVRVFVLDTMPSPEQIKQASDLANPANGFPRNRLLQDMATGMQSAHAFNDQSSLNAEPPAINVYYQDLPDKVVCNPPGPGCHEPPRTGEDLYKRLIGFAAPDHGLFIAGIIRDLAPGAKIECVRVLNDYAVGDFSTLTQALEAIHIRMSSGDLMNTPVVINLSLVMSPDTRTLDDLGFKTQDYVKTAKDLREPLHQALKSVVNRGAVVVAAAGSDSNTLAMPGRHDPRYPAGFTEVVSVAGVTGSGEATDYSNRAASAGRPHGIATYGGSIATPVPPPTSRTSAQVAPKRTNCMTGAKDIDALIGVYTSPTYSWS
jgi:Subtilase family